MNGQQSVISRHNQLGVRYPRRVAGLRVGIGIFLLAVMSVLYVSSHGNPWVFLLAAGAALHFYLAYYGLRNARNGASKPALS